MDRSGIDAAIAKAKELLGESNSIDSTGITSTISASVVDKSLERDQVPPEIAILLKSKQSEYTKSAKAFRNLHYLLLLSGALLSIATPFLIPIYPHVAQGTSLSIAAIVAFDQIFKPKEKWINFSEASDLITVQYLQLNGTYEPYKEIIDTIVNTESKSVRSIPDLDTVISRMIERSSQG